VGFPRITLAIEYFNLAVIECVLIVFMLWAAMNFATYFLAWREKSLKLYLRDTKALSTIIMRKFIFDCFANVSLNS
jgi:trk system potassium uptake protein TrkH